MKRMISLFLTACMCFSMGILLTSCDDQEDHEHAYKAEWAYDDTHHWHACEGCAEVSDKTEHSWSDGVLAGSVKTYTCTTCGKTRTETVTVVDGTPVVKEPDESLSSVTKEQWNAMLQALYDGNFQAVMSSGAYANSITVTDSLIKEQRAVGDSVTTEYYANEGGMATWYKYENHTWCKQPYLTGDNWSDGLFMGVDHATWEQVFRWNSAGVIDDMLPIELLELELFSYDGESGIYYCDSIEIAYGSGSSDYLKNIRVSFAVDKLLKIEYDFCDDIEGINMYHCAFSCAAADLVIALPDPETVVTLPTDYSQVDETVTTIDTEYDWQKAIVDFQKNHRIQCVRDGKTITILKDRIKIEDELGTVYYVNDNGTSYEIFEDQVSDPDDDNPFVWKKAQDSEYVSWEERRLAVMRDCFTGLGTNNWYWGYDLFEYQETKYGNYYYLSEYEDEHGSRFQYEAIRLYFENGMLTGMSLDYNNSEKWNYVELSLAEENSIVLPSVDE